MKGTLTSNFSTYLLVERMGLSTQTLWWYLLLSTSSSNSFASAALLPSNERPPSALAAVSKASWENQQKPGLFLSVAFQHFQWKRCDYAKKLWQEMKEDMFVSMYWASTNIISKKYRGRNPVRLLKPNKLYRLIMPWGKTTEGTSSLVLRVP